MPPPIPNKPESTPETAMPIIRNKPVMIKKNVSMNLPKKRSISYISLSVHVGSVGNICYIVYQFANGFFEDALCCK